MGARLQGGVQESTPRGLNSFFKKKNISFKLKFQLFISMILYTKLQSCTRIYKSTPVENCWARGEDMKQVSIGHVNMQLCPQWVGHLEVPIKMRISRRANQVAQTWYRRGLRPRDPRPEPPTAVQASLSWQGFRRSHSAQHDLRRLSS